MTGARNRRVLVDRQVGPSLIVADRGKSRADGAEMLLAIRHWLRQTTAPLRVFPRPIARGLQLAANQGADFGRFHCNLSHAAQIKLRRRRRNRVTAIKWYSVIRSGRTLKAG
jgi:hypothetical protein